MESVAWCQVEALVVMKQRWCGGWQQPWLWWRWGDEKEIVDGVSGRNGKLEIGRTRLMDGDYGGWHGGEDGWHWDEQRMATLKQREGSTMGDWVMSTLHSDEGEGMEEDGTASDGWSLVWPVMVWFMVKEWQCLLEPVVIMVGYFSYSFWVDLWSISLFQLHCRP